MKRLILLTIIAIASTEVGAQTLTLSDARKMALENNVNMAKARAQKEKASYDEKVYKSN